MNKTKFSILSSLYLILGKCYDNKIDPKYGQIMKLTEGLLKQSNKMNRIAEDMIGFEVYFWLNDILVDENFHLNVDNMQFKMLELSDEHYFCS